MKDEHLQPTGYTTSLQTCQPRKLKISILWVQNPYFGPQIRIFHIGHPIMKVLSGGTGIVGFVMKSGKAGTCRARV